MLFLRWFSRHKLSPYVEAEPSSHKRRGERTARRERLYGVVRECMTNAGVLSASYKFKVLSLDSRGRQFLVMVDLMTRDTGAAGALAQVETAIAHAAKTRHGIAVKAVYWRQEAPAQAESHFASSVPTSL